MSRRVTVRLKARRPSDVPQMIKSVANAAADGVDLDVYIDHEPTKKKRSSRVRKDENLETMVNETASRELDKLAEAAAEFKLDELQAIRDSAERQVKSRSSIRSWMTAMAKAGWVTVVKVMAEKMLKGGGPG